MSTNTEIIKKSYAAFARSDIDAAMELFSPAIKWTHPDGMNDYGLGGTKKGREQILDFMTQTGPVFSELRPTPQDFVESGDRVMVIVDGRLQAFDTADALAAESVYYRSASFLAAGARSGDA